MKFNVLDSVNKERSYIIISDKLRNKIKSSADKKALIKKTQISRMTLERIMHLDGYWSNFNTVIKICNNLCIKESYIKNNIIKVKTKDSQTVSTMSINLNQNFARIVGHLLGDGGIHINEKQGKFRIFYVNNEDVLLNSFSDDFESIFPEVSLYKRTREDRGNEVWLPTTVGSILYNIFNMSDCKLRRVPNFIWDSNKLIKGAFIQAIFDDEGFIYPQKNIIAIALSNKELLNDIKFLLESLEIRSNPIKETNNKTRSKMFYFYITGKENILKFYKNVGFLHPIKSTKLNTLVSKYGEKVCAA